MTRLRRFERHRFVGTRDDMVAYDCDQGDELEMLEHRIRESALDDRLLLQTFAPDDPAEARNRGFRVR